MIGQDIGICSKESTSPTPILVTGDSSTGKYGGNFKNTKTIHLIRGHTGI